MEGPNNVPVVRKVCKFCPTEVPIQTEASASQQTVETLRKLFEFLDMSGMTLYSELLHAKASVLDLRWLEGIATSLCSECLSLVELFGSTLEMFGSKHILSIECVRMITNRILMVAPPGFEMDSEEIILKSKICQNFGPMGRDPKLDKELAREIELARETLDKDLSDNSSEHGGTGVDVGDCKLNPRDVVQHRLEDDPEWPRYSARVVNGTNDNAGELELEQADSQNVSYNQDGDDPGMFSSPVNSYTEESNEEQADHVTFNCNFCTQHFRNSFDHHTHVVSSHEREYLTGMCPGVNIHQLNAEIQKIKGPCDICGVVQHSMCRLCGSYAVDSEEFRLHALQTHLNHILTKFDGTL